MHACLIEPLAPLVFRSGRPFGEGSRDGANFPWPSSLAGMLRTFWAEHSGAAVTEYDAHQLQALAARGPLLARREGERITPLLPKPADALYLLPDGDSSQPCVYRLQPGEHPPGTGSNLPQGLSPVVLQAHAPKGKPKAGPEFWPLEQLLAWRAGNPVALDALAHAKPLVDVRTHVGIDRHTLAAAAGKLFQVQGLDFGPARTPTGYESAHWVLLGWFQEQLPAGAVCLGGERRLSWLQPLSADLLSAPRAYLQATERAPGLVLTLVTPALFAAGWRPGWLDENLEGQPPGVPGLRLRLRAAAVERWQGLSGWDLCHARPKAARKAVAAGATYWFEILDRPAGEWASALWLAPVCDDPQDRRDGFGLVIPGPWVAHDARH